MLPNRFSHRIDIYVCTGWSNRCNVAATIRALAHAPRSLSSGADRARETTQKGWKPLRPVDFTVLGREGIRPTDGMKAEWRCVDSTVWYRDEADIGAIGTRALSWARGR